MLTSVERLGLAMQLARRAWKWLDLIADDGGLETDFCAPLVRHPVPNAPQQVLLGVANEA